MNSRLALGLALGSAALAVGIVAADIELGLEIEIQEDQDGRWVAVAKDDLRMERYGGGSCPGQDLRIVVDNDRLIGADESVRLSYFDANSHSTEIILDEVWQLDRNEERTFEFRVPDTAFNMTEKGNGFFSGVSVELRVGDQYLSTCVEADA